MQSHRENDGKRSALFQVCHAEAQPPSVQNNEREKEGGGGASNKKNKNDALIDLRAVNDTIANIISGITENVAP